MAKNSIEIENYQIGDKVGFSISNFINTMKNNNLMLSGQIDLFMNYLDFFLSSQCKQYTRIRCRMRELLMEMDENIEKSNKKNMYQESYPSVSELSETDKNREPIIKNEILLEVLPEKTEPKLIISQKELSNDIESSPELEMSFE